MKVPTDTKKGGIPYTAPKPSFSSSFRPGLTHFIFNCLLKKKRGKLSSLHNNMSPKQFT